MHHAGACGGRTTVPAARHFIPACAVETAGLHSTAHSTRAWVLTRTRHSCAAVQCVPGHSPTYRSHQVFTQHRLTSMRHRQQRASAWQEKQGQVQGTGGSHSSAAGSMQARCSMQGEGCTFACSHRQAPFQGLPAAHHVLQHQQPHSTAQAAAAAPHRPVAKSRRSLGGGQHTGMIPALVLFFMWLAVSIPLGHAITPPSYFCSYTAPSLGSTCPLCDTGSACNVSYQNV